MTNDDQVSKHDYERRYRANITNVLDEHRKSCVVFRANERTNGCVVDDRVSMIENKCDSVKISHVERLSRDTSYKRASRNLSRELTRDMSRRDELAST